MHFAKKKETFQSCNQLTVYIYWTLVKVYCIELATILFLNTWHLPIPNIFSINGNAYAIKHNVK